MELKKKLKRTQKISLNFIFILINQLVEFISTALCPGLEKLCGGKILQSTMRVKFADF